MPHFFALPDDIRRVMDEVESRRALKYTLTGQHTSPDVACFLSATAIPTLGAPATSDSAVSCPSYLVTDRDKPVVPRAIRRLDGAPCWAIDQLENPDSTVFWHGGLYEGAVLLHGRVATVSTSPVARSLQRAIATVIRRRFRRIGAYFVGERAEELLDSGVRLTSSLHTPREYDLKRPLDVAFRATR